MTTLAFVLGVCIAALGVSGVFAPSWLVWIAQHAMTSGAFYLIGAVRVALGLVLVSAASASRAPRTLRVMGYVIVIAGVATMVTGLVAMEWARALIDAWLQQGVGIIRVTCAVVAVIGGFIAYACVPGRR